MSLLTLGPRNKEIFTESCKSGFLERHSTRFFYHGVEHRGDPLRQINSSFLKPTHQSCLGVTSNITSHYGGVHQISTSLISNDSVSLHDWKFFGHFQLGHAYYVEVPANRRWLRESRQELVGFVGAKSNFRSGTRRVGLIVRLHTLTR